MEMLRSAQYVGKAVSAKRILEKDIAAVDKTAVIMCWCFATWEKLDINMIRKCFISCKLPVKPGTSKDDLIIYIIICQGK